jgi:hypothetical protein
MATKLRSTLIALTAAAAATTTIAATAASSSASPSHTLTLYGTARTLPNDGFVDVDHNQQFSGGDEFLMADVLRDRAHRQVGIDRGTCTVIRVQGTDPDTASAENSCIGTADLTDGSLTFQGIEYTSKNIVRCAVTGGTGRYDGASGWVLVTLHDGGDSSTLTFFLRDR